jgi:hypothetical protein
VVLPDPSPSSSKDSFADEYQHYSLPLNSEPMNWSYNKYSDRDPYNSRLSDPQEVGKLISAVRRNRRERQGKANCTCMISTLSGIKEPYPEYRYSFSEEPRSDYRPPPQVTQNPQLLPPQVPHEDRMTPRTPRSNVAQSNHVPKVTIPAINASIQLEETAPLVETKPTPRVTMAIQ